MRKRSENRHNSCETRRQADRRWLNKLARKMKQRDRLVYCPERNIDRFYVRYNFERQPSLWCNTKGGKHIGRYI